ncbi:PREDICTED: leucine-rich repeat flightless-interacting protein 1-like isoform X6 [Poecilia mexicana]|uniref:leucine-rich repeat flightless-interacting protein 1-like isoform X6 n=1 Tax=Poecilia mexicana TaxID=48701 RepID=UPI00072E3758|nr:PREDICTED: leucine-rich repeat flightless-interacting protein 1-like isoform X6 [Poecilia mexicana]
MGTQGPGRKRIPNRDKLAAEEDALSQIAREAEARLAAKRAARAEAREIRMKELERQQKEEDSERYSRLSRRHTSISDDEERMSVGSRGSYRPSDYGGLLASSSRASSRASSARASPVVEERTDREFTDKGSRTASTLSAATLASLGGASSRRGSCDTSFSVETEASIREMKDSLAEAEEKYRRAMVSNAQLHNDKTALMFQVENLMEELSDVEELLWEARRRWDDATKELERERQAHSVLKVQFKQTEETLRQTNELLTNHGVVVSPDTTTNGDADQTEEESPSRLAEDSPHSGRESMLGKASQQKPADGSRTPQNVPKHKKRSLPQNVISVSDQTKPSRERQNPTEKHPGRNRQTRSKAGEKNRPKKLPVRTDGNEAKKKQPSKEDPAHKVLRSRLVPPRPAKDIILDNRAMVLGLSAAEKLNSPSEEAVKQDASLALQSESSSETNFEQKHMSTSDLDSQSQDEDRNAEDDVSGFSEEGPSLKAAAESNKSNVEAVGGEEGFVRRTEASPETKVHFTSPENQSIGEPLQRAAEVHKACPESPKRTPPFVPEEMWTSLEMNVQDLLQGLEDKPGFVVEISRIFSEILMCLHHWISDLENTLRNRAGRESCLNDRGAHESVWPLRGTRLSKWLLTSLTRETAEGPGCEEGHLAGRSSSPRVSSAREKMEDPPGSSSRVCSTCHDQSTTNDEREITSSPRDVQLNAESEASPPGSLKSISGNFVFVESHFSESYKNSTDSTPDSQTHVLTSAKDSKEFRGNRPSSAHSSVGQSSSGGLKRFMEVTAEEIRAMAVPELALVGLQEGRRLDRSSIGSVEELSVGDMDSCEEADEEEEVQLLPPQQQNRSTMEAEVQVIAPSLGTMEPETEHEESGLDSRKNDNTDCNIS